MDIFFSAVIRVASFQGSGQMSSYHSLGVRAEWMIG
jgi:hypothetical protein